MRGSGERGAPPGGEDGEIQGGRELGEVETEEVGRDTRGREGRGACVGVASLSDRSWERGYVRGSICKCSKAADFISTRARDGSEACGILNEYENGCVFVYACVRVCVVVRMCVLMFVR